MTFRHCQIRIYVDSFTVLSFVYLYRHVLFFFFFGFTCTVLGVKPPFFLLFKMVFTDFPILEIVPV